MRNWQDCQPGKWHPPRPRCNSSRHLEKRGARRESPGYKVDVDTWKTLRNPMVGNSRGFHKNAHNTQSKGVGEFLHCFAYFAWGWVLIQVSIEWRCLEAIPKTQFAAPAGPQFPATRLQPAEKSLQLPAQWNSLVYLFRSEAPQHAQLFTTTSTGASGDRWCSRACSLQRSVWKRANCLRSRTMPTIHPSHRESLGEKSQKSVQKLFGTIVCYRYL